MSQLLLLVVSVKHELSFPLKNRTSLDQTTLNQSVSVNGVHSDNDTSQVRHISKCFDYYNDSLLSIFFPNIKKIPM